jgi:hypothetical protein
MQSAEEIEAFIARQPEMVQLLHAVDALGLPDCWIGAGFVRNAVWDALHGRAPDCTLLNDVDVVFHDRADPAAVRDRVLEARLAAHVAGVPWSVKNQARMHTRNHEAPYVDTADALARWPETATAVAVRPANGAVELLAPHGIGDLIGLLVRPTPAFMSRRDQVARRFAEKGWRARWPKLRLTDF